MNSPSARSSLIVSLAALTCVAALGALALAAHAVLMTSTDAGSAMSQAASLTGQAALLQQKSELALKTKPEQDALTALVIAKGGSAQYLSSIEDLAAQAHVAITVGSLTATPPAGGAPGSLNLSVQTAGSWAASMRFLELLETQHLAQDISGVDFVYDESAKRWQGTLAISALSLDSP